MTDLESLLKAVLSHPAESTLRGMLQDELIATDCWEWQTLLGFIRTHPESDGLRLLAADWLDADGQCARADFIRVQCALASLMKEYPDSSASRPEYDEFMAIQAGLTRVICSTLTQGVIHPAQVTWEQTEDGWVTITGGGAAIEYDRGFAARCLMDSSVFLAKAGELFRNNPITYVRLTDKMPVRVAEGWWWADSCLNPADPTSCTGYLPPDLYEALLEGDRSGRRRSVPRSAADLTFPTQDAAIAALSGACLVYGRALVMSDPYARGGIPEPARNTSVRR